MVEFFRTWYVRNFSHPDSARLVLILIAFSIIIVTIGNLLKPIFASIIIAYLLDGLVTKLKNLRIHHTISVLIVFIFFISVFLIAFLFILPILWQQLTNLIHDFPTMLSQSHFYVIKLFEKYSKIIPDEVLKTFYGAFKGELASIGQILFSISIASIPNFIMVLVYLILVPLFVYFFLMDKNLILGWVINLFFSQSTKLQVIWSEINEKIGKYVRGKVTEMLIVTGVTLIVFTILDLNFSFLLSFVVGLSVFIPFVGAALATVPVVIIAFVQWDLSSQFITLMLWYALILTLDANVLVPLLFSGAVKLHPLVIIFAIILFGGLWGFWGVFFAIPLAIAIKSVLYLWPKQLK